jgi:ABC-type cobalamin/Fe3+-siderophores transport system ATPase subunit
VLVLDDPTSVFDAPNQAGLISTLRAFVRLRRPAQLVVTTHDGLVAAVLAEELAPVDGWPTGSRRLRCQRDSSDCTVIVAGPARQEPLSVESEVDRLGIGATTVHRSGGSFEVSRHAPRCVHPLGRTGLA